MAIRNYSTAFKNLVATTSGKSYADCLAHGTICLFGGTMPASADAAEGSVPLCQITLNSGTFTPGSNTNSINLGTATGGVVSKNVGEVWSGLGTAAAGTGTVATWARWYNNAMITGLDGGATAVRVDLDVATAGASIILGSTTIILGATTTIDTMALTIS